MDQPPSDLVLHNAAGAGRERRWLLASVWVASVLFACSFVLADPDLWGHVLYGLRAIDQGVLVERTDPFSYTAPSAPWVNHEWLTEYQFGLLWSHWGNTALSLWRNVLVVAVFAVAAVAIRRSSATLPAAVALLVFNAECLSDFVVFVRPQLTTFALFAVTLLLLRRFWDDPSGRAVWCLPALTALWCNLHGGFLAGIGIQGMFAGAASLATIVRRGDRSRAVSLSLVFAASLVATLINPYGIGLHAMLWRHLGTEQAVREWQALYAARQSLTYYVPFGLVLLSLPGFRRKHWIDALVLAVVGLQAVAHIRHVALLSVTTLILLPGPLSTSLHRLFPALHRRWSRPEARRVRIAAVVGVHLLLAGIIGRGVWPRWSDGIRPWTPQVETRSQCPGMPVRAVGFIKAEGLRGRLVTDYGWGQYVVWQLYPQTRIAFDGRYRTVYPPEVEREFLRFEMSGGNSSETAILDEYDTDMALLPAGHSRTELLDDRAGWVRLYADDQSTLYVRDRPKFRDAIARSRGGLSTAPRVPTWCAFPAAPDRLGNPSRSPGLPAAARSARPNVSESTSATDDAGERSVAAR